MKKVNTVKKLEENIVKVKIERNMNKVNNVKILEDNMKKVKKEEKLEKTIEKVNMENK